MKKLKPRLVTQLLRGNMGTRSWASRGPIPWYEFYRIKWRESIGSQQSFLTKYRKVLCGNTYNHMEAKCLLISDLMDRNLCSPKNKNSSPRGIHLQSVPMKSEWNTDQAGSPPCPSCPCGRLQTRWGKGTVEQVRVNRVACLLSLKSIPTSINYLSDKWLNDQLKLAVYPAYKGGVISSGEATGAAFLTTKIHTWPAS